MPSENISSCTSSICCRYKANELFVVAIWVPIRQIMQALRSDPSSMHEKLNKLSVHVCGGTGALPQSIDSACCKAKKYRSAAVAELNVGANCTSREKSPSLGTIIINQTQASQWEHKTTATMTWIKIKYLDDSSNVWLALIKRRSRGSLSNFAICTHQIRIGCNLSGMIIMKNISVTNPDGHLTNSRVRAEVSRDKPVKRHTSHEINDKPCWKITPCNQFVRPDEFAIVQVRSKKSDSWLYK